MPETARLKKVTATEQLLQLVSDQAQLQGKSLAQYLRELQSLVGQKREGSSMPRSSTPRFPRQKYVYLTRREVELFFEQVTDLRDRALFGCIYHFGLRASEVDLLLRERVNFCTRRHAYMHIDLMPDHPSRPGFSLRRPLNVNSDSTIFSAPYQKLF